jgi:hypothetical protein
MVAAEATTTSVNKIEGGDRMLKAILGFAAGFLITGFAVESGSVRKFKEVAAEKAARVKSAACKAAAAAREEFSTKAEETAAPKK